MSLALDSTVLPPGGAENVADRADAAHCKDRRTAQVTGRPVVFLGHDYILNQILDEIGRRLECDGCEVVRGPGATPPPLGRYPREDWPRPFGRADVIVISTRTHCPRDLLLSAPRLRGVVFPTIGTEAVDLADAQDLGLVIGHGPTPENFTGMAEACVMLIVRLSCSICPARSA
jgi:D-isomer specific 2-hydroxyacid dehydrogenase, catalytic domain